jgi:hypothetical protein
MYHSDRSGSCWIWTASITSEGYGQLGIGNRVLRAHRVSYETFVGPIPEGMTVDHLCRVRSCVKVEHLELVTVAENNRRKKTTDGLRVGGECIFGHEITDLTIYRHPRGHLECRTCRRDQKRRANSKRAS